MWRRLQRLQALCWTLAVTSTQQIRCGSLSIAVRTLCDMAGLMALMQLGKTAEQYTAMLGRVNIRELEGRQVVADKIAQVLDARHEAEWHAAQASGGE